VPDDHTSGEHRTSPPDPETDLGAELEAGPLGAASEEAGKKDAPGSTSLDALLKKFGIK
jgi:hypothetical protein